MKQQICQHMSDLVPPTDTTVIVRCGQCHKNFQWNEKEEKYVYIGTDKEVKQ